MTIRDQICIWTHLVSFQLTFSDIKLGRDFPALLWTARQTEHKRHKTCAFVMAIVRATGMLETDFAFRWHVIRLWANWQECFNFCGHDAAWQKKYHSYLLTWDFVCSTWLFPGIWRMAPRTGIWPLKSKGNISNIRPQPFSSILGTVFHSCWMTVW